MSQQLPPEPPPVHQSHYPQQPPPPQYVYVQHEPSKGIAALLSFFIPGVGQMYRGQVVAGILWLFIVLAGYVCFIVPGLILHIICIIAAAA